MAKGKVSPWMDGDMNVVNAIAKVRFNSAHAKRVQLHKLPAFECELLCLEPGQEFPASGPCAYYIVAGNGAIKAGPETQELSMGQLAYCDDGEEHAIVNTSEQRLICLSVS